MRAQEFITDARRNPEKNPRAKGHDAVVDYLKSLGHLSNVGISMTNLPKLGLNPSSTYRTPLGVYFYPAEYYITRVEEGRGLPFQDKAPYAQIFDWMTGKILYINDVDNNTFNFIANTLLKMYGRRKIDKLYEDAFDYASVNSEGGRIWYVLWQLADESKNPPIAWNKLLRDIGYDIVIDNGGGIIHPSEPTQGVVINPRVINQLDQIQRDYRKGNTHTPLNDRLQDAIDSGEILSGKLKDAMAQTPPMALQYALYTLRGRFPEAEPYLVKSPLAWRYAKDILKHPWPEAEPAIAKNAHAAYEYVVYVLKNRFPAGEHEMKKEPYVWKKYIEKFPEAAKEDNEMMQADLKDFDAYTDVNDIHESEWN